MELSPPTVQSLYLVPMANGQPLATATGFVVEYEGEPFLITNYHVVAGRNPATGQPLHTSGAVPEVVRVAYMLPAASDRIEWEPRDEPVLDSQDRPLWIEHPDHGRRVDVVALQLTNSDGAFMLAYDPQPAAPILKVGPADGVSIVGFPFGETAGGGFGIWTRGFIASEPEVDWNGLPRFLIDARTRPGQSGSPVIAYRPDGGAVLGRNGLGILSGPIVELLGVYSGRINEQSDLGFVWKSETIRAILKGQQRGASGLGPLPTVAPDGL